MRHVNVSFVLLLASTLAAASLAPGAGADDAAPPRGAVKLALGDEQIPIEDLLRALSEHTGVPLVWNPSDRQIRGKTVNGSLDLTMSPEDLFQQVRALLTFYQLVFVPVGAPPNQVVLVMDAQMTSSLLKLKPEHVRLTDENLGAYEHQDGLFVTTTIQVEHMEDLRNARNALTRIVTGQNIGNVTEVPAARVFVVTDFAPNVVAVYRLLRAMDHPQEKPSTTGGLTVAVPVVHAAAADLAAVLEQHYRPHEARRTKGEAEPPAPDAPRITADERTNQILVTGTEVEIDRLKAAIRLLDTPVRPQGVEAHVVPLQHVEAQGAASALGSLISMSPRLWADPAATPSVVAHPDGKALLVAAGGTDFETLRALIAELDTGR